MLTDKEVKNKFRQTFYNNPEKYYPVEILKQEGYTRYFCENCKKPFWSMKKSSRCGDPSCNPELSFGFIGNTPAKEKLSYVDVWKNFSAMFKKFGYTPIKRYPTVARWNPTLEYTNASIAAFQPFVISGEIQPPANPLVIPQFCLRFGDIDNVGITMSHHTGFVMIGQHMFVPPEKWDQNEVFRHIHEWNTKGLGLKNEDLTYHEDAWAGGGNFGCCMEFFSKGCELGNQVYMLYEQTPTGHRDLNLKVLDMGMGMERNAWFSQGSSTIYDAVFPAVNKKLYSITGYKPDEALLKKYVPNAGLLNADETDDMEGQWKIVAKRAGTTSKELKEAIIPLSAIYSIGEHTRTLLVSLTDGALPSNVGGAHNLRMLYRRARSMQERQGWKLELNDVTEWHAKELKPLFPELNEHLETVKRILSSEDAKYRENKSRTKQIIEKIITKKVDTKTILELYDSQGIDPKEIQDAAKTKGQKIDVPDNFYALLSERHQLETPQKAQTKRHFDIDTSTLAGTELLYWQHYDLFDFEARVLKAEGNFVVLDRTAFYPTSGGQEHDSGKINDERVVDCAKNGNVVIHIMEVPTKLKVGMTVGGKVDSERRIQLAQHHTSTHIIGGAAKKVLGDHIWQAGAAKSIEKARLDVTHYETITDEQLKQIENEANRIIKENKPVFKEFMPRNVAEARYGFRIYQGGAVPGKEIRIVELQGWDVQACGGTHLNNTGEAVCIKILKSSKVQDGAIRIEFVAGNAALKFIETEKTILDALSQELNCDYLEIPGRIEELFELWKKAKKAGKSGLKLTADEKKLKSKVKHAGDVLSEASRILKTQPEHLVKTVQRFKSEV
ncbi:MAG: alanine--tRNA ligase [Candidatus Woesearchaeota archaeon]